MSTVIYGIGGYRPAHPSQGKIEEHVDAASTVTRWDDAGTVIEIRPYTAEEVAAAVAVATAATQEDVKTTIEERMEAFIVAGNQYLALPSPNTTQNIAVIRWLVRAVIGLIKIHLRQLDSTDGT